ncbi:response regulator transcription factor SaeR [Staphylococcus caprae]|uniref:response regulator transcription factor SaeR n=1 Tax=Staphylococcus caprae TaxID=29380 RepID=UPI000E6A4EF4|nr:response regulator transcription factor SaeR [Staphylococcus caprae]MBU5271664.1 response regulator transcription factor SaeR [Staphylococcus caprae]MDK6296698.1 response regulator transcription factor SaeR [Staphylococcus caprae]MDK7232974.1 response regulator transcription factor SaeR [Staphylococcus caprae]RIM36397.1 DNA-binding response regulator [Staphylococcus caprae]
MTHLLIVDDEQDIVDICQTYFEYEGYQVTTTTNGKEAIQLLSSDIDVMILDIMMPEVSGYDIVKEMKAKQLDIPFIYLTAKTQEHDTIYALTLGADDYVKKPFSPRELVLRTNNLLTRISKYQSSNRIEQLEFNGLILNNSSKTLTIDHQEIPMRIKEFELLWYLASRENDVISKSELLEKVWGYDYYEDANTVNVHIHRIREKLEKHHFITYTITTVWGLGYKFERSR